MQVYTSATVTFQTPLELEYVQPILAKMTEMFDKTLEGFCAFMADPNGLRIESAPIQDYNKFMRWFANAYPSLTYCVEETDTAEDASIIDELTKGYYGPEAIEFEIQHLRETVEETNKRIAALRKTLRNRAQV